jgi:hypothetical protein
MLLRFEFDLRRVELLLAMGPALPNGEKDWLRLCVAVMDGDIGDIGDDTMVDFDRKCPEGVPGDRLADALRLKGLLRHFGPF